MTAHLKAAEPYERSVFQGYVDKYSKFYAMCTMWFYSTCTMMIVGTFFINDPFPTAAEYPFAVDYEPLRSIIFIHQGFTCVQCASQVSMNGFAAVLLLFVTARFEILMTELRQVDNIHSLVQCLKKHYDTRR